MRRVLMLFNRPRAERMAVAEQGRCPDELLYGLRTLKARGWQVEFSDDGFGDFFGGRALKLLDDLLSSRGRLVGFHIKQAWRLRRQIDQADVVFATADSSGLPVLLLRALGLTQTPVVYASIGLTTSFPHQFGIRFSAYRALLRQAAQVVAYSKTEVEALACVFSVDRQRLRFIPFGVEAAFFTGQEADSGRPLAFGLDHRRDWSTLFSAAAGLEATIEVIANPDMLRGLAPPRNVVLLPPESVTELRRRLLAAPFVILPVKQNDYTGATISLLQSMAAGRAVIVSQTKALESGYGLADGENCLLVPPGDVPRLAQAMRMLREDRQLADRLGRRAAEHVRQSHDISHLVERIEETLCAALS